MQTTPFLLYRAYLCSPELSRFAPDLPLPWEKQPFGIKMKMIQHIEQLSAGLQKCDNSWVAQQIAAYKVKNKRDNILRKLPNRAPSSSTTTSSLASTSSSTIAMDEDVGDVDDGSHSTELHDDVVSDTAFQTAIVDPTTAATRRAEIESILSTTSRRGRGGTRGGRGRARGGHGRGAKQQPTANTQPSFATQSFVQEVPMSTERKPSRKVRENKEVEEVVSAKRKADEELKEGRAKVRKKSRANLEGLFKKWAQEASEVYEEVDGEVLWLGGLKFVGSYEDRRQIWTQAEPDEADDEVIDD